MSLLIAAILLQTTTPAAAQPDAAAPATPALKKVAAKTGSDKMICKADTPVGSRLPGPRICHTAAEWSAISFDARSNTEQSQKR